MSTYMYIHCVTHDPYISSGQVGHNTGDLPAIRRDIRERDEVVELWTKMWEASEVGIYPDFHDSYVNERRSFLVSHPHCDLEIWDEHGQQYSMEDTVEEKPIAADTVLGHVTHIEQTEEGVVVTMRNLTPEGERVFRKLSQ